MEKILVGIVSRKNQFMGCGSRPQPVQKNKRQIIFSSGH